MNNSLKKLIYRSKHRGNKEMDIMLGNFAINGINTLQNNELEVYSKLLDESDNDIWDWAAGVQPVPDVYADVIKKVVNATR